MVMVVGFVLVSLIGLSHKAKAGDSHRAPDEPPVIDREDWCVFGTPTRTTGECMCRWSDKNACQGSKCQFEFGLAWHHFTCLDCACQPKPKGVGAGNNLRSHMAGGNTIAKRLFELKSLVELGLIEEKDYQLRKAEIIKEV